MSDRQQIKKILSDEHAFMKVVQASFNSVDMNRSGEIEEKELYTAMKMMAKESGISPPVDEDLKKMFQELDSNQSGKIEISEYAVFVRNILEANIDSDDDE